MSKLRLGTRGSRLAMAQANTLKAQLTAIHPDVEIEIVPIKTSGDQGNREQLGAFVHEIQLALLDNRIDVALHCLKDLPTRPVPGLLLAAHLKREDARDTIITRGTNWIDLPRDSVIGTGSVRRTSQLASHRPDFRFKPLVGNVDTRLRKLMEGEYDAIILAIAGLKRLGVLDCWSESEYRGLDVEPLAEVVMLPAPGQAILVLETRETDPVSQEAVAMLNDLTCQLEALAERSFLKAFGGGCSVPVAARAEVSGDSLTLHGLVAAPDGSRVIRGTRAGALCDAGDVGTLLAEELVGHGAMDLFESGEGQ